MVYTVLRGQFVIRYADQPRQGPEPDGDTVKFQPDTPALVETLPRRSGTPADLGMRGISVRLEAVDALETHFGDTHQELAGANAARDLLLAELGFTNVRYFADLPNKVESADQDAVRGHVLSNGIDANGRVIGFVHRGDPDLADGSRVFVDEALVDTSVNAGLLDRGMVYPAFYGTLPATLRTHLAATSRAARAAHRGIWARATGDPDGAAEVASLAQLETLVLWPKLFRRLVPYLAAGFTDLDGFDSWLRADPVHRDDALFLLDRLEPGNMHDVVHGTGDHVQLTVWPEDFVIEPDPATTGGGTVPTLPHVADLLRPLSGPGARTG
jgi:endonuclease YncB( thermonuclease family)